MNCFAVEIFDRKTLAKTRVAPKAFTEKGLYMLATKLLQIRKLACMLSFRFVFLPYEREEENNGRVTE